MNIPSINITPIKKTEVKIDTAAFNKIGEITKNAIEKSNSICDISKLTTFKMKTILGKKLPVEDILEVEKLVKEMYKKGNLTDEDVSWCIQNCINYK